MSTDVIKPAEPQPVYADTYTGCGRAAREFGAHSAAWGDDGSCQAVGDRYLCAGAGAGGRQVLCAESPREKA